MGLRMRSGLICPIMWFTGSVLQTAMKLWVPKSSGIMYWPRRTLINGVYARTSQNINLVSYCQWFTASSIVIQFIFVPVGGMVKSVIEFCYGIMVLSAVVQLEGKTLHTVM